MAASKDTAPSAMLEGVPELVGICDNVSLGARRSMDFLMNTHRSVTSDSLEAARMQAVLKCDLFASSISQWLHTLQVCVWLGTLAFDAGFMAAVSAGTALGKRRLFRRAVADVVDDKTGATKSDVFFDLEEALQELYDSLKPLAKLCASRLGLPDAPASVTIPSVSPTPTGTTGTPQMPMTVAATHVQVAAGHASGASALASLPRPTYSPTGGISAPTAASAALSAASSMYQQSPGGSTHLGSLPRSTTGASESAAMYLNDVGSGGSMFAPAASASLPILQSGSAQLLPMYNAAGGSLKPHTDSIQPQHGVRPTASPASRYFEVGQAVVSAPARLADASAMNRSPTGTASYPMAAAAPPASLYASNAYASASRPFMDGATPECRSGPATSECVQPLWLQLGFAISDMSVRWEVFWSALNRLLLIHTADTAESEMHAYSGLVDRAGTVSPRMLHRFLLIFTPAEEWDDRTDSIFNLQHLAASVNTFMAGSVPGVFAGYASRDVVMNVLQAAGPGHFIVRLAASQPCNVVISVSEGSSQVHTLVNLTPAMDAFTFQGSVFRSLAHLVGSCYNVLPWPAIAAARIARRSHLQFEAFHGLISYDETVKRLKDALPGSYLMRMSQSARGAFVVAFVNGTGAVAQTLVTAAHPSSMAGAAAVECSKRVYPTLVDVFNAHSSIFSRPIPAIVQVARVRDAVTLSPAVVGVPSAPPWHTSGSARAGAGGMPANPPGPVQLGASGADDPSDMPGPAPATGGGSSSAYASPPMTMLESPPPPAAGHAAYQALHVASSDATSRGAACAYVDSALMMAPVTRGARSGAVRNGDGHGRGGVDNSYLYSVPQADKVESYLPSAGGDPASAGGMQAGVPKTPVPLSDHHTHPAASAYIM